MLVFLWWRLGNVPESPVIYGFGGLNSFGAVFGRHWFYGIWPGHWKTYNIVLLELLPILIAVHIWGSLMSNKRVMFFSDNAAAVDAIHA